MGLAGGGSVFPGSQGQFSHVNTRASSLGMGDAEAAGEMPDQLSSGQTTRTSSSMAPWPLGGNMGHEHYRRSRL